MRIAVVSMIKESWGGSEELWAAMAEEALKNGHKVHFSALDCGEVSPKINGLIKKGVQVHYRRGYVEPGISLLSRVFQKGSIYILNKIDNPFTRILSLKPDIIIYNGTCYSIADDYLLLDVVNKSNSLFYIIGHFNSDNQKLLSANKSELIKESYNIAQKVFFISKRNLENAKRHLSSDIKNSQIIRNPVNLQSISIVPYPSEGKINMAMVGNLIVDHKGQDLVFDILRRAGWLSRDWHLNIYGKGPDENYLKELCRFYNIEARVTFHGKVTDIRKVWSENHLLLMPSIMEGMPLAVVEAMLCGRPSVVTDVGGHTEWIADGIEGFVAEAASVNSLAIAMDRCWQEKENWELIGRHAHEKAKALYDPEPGKTLLKIITENIP